MRTHLFERVIEEGEYIVKNKATVRQAAKYFKVSKSTIYLDVTSRLLSVDRELARKVKQVLDRNKEERHIRGGNATSIKYRAQKIKKRMSKT